MPRTVRYVIGWLLAATAAVGLAWAVISDAIGTGPTAPIAAVAVGTGSPPPLPPASGNGSPTLPTGPATSGPDRTVPSAAPSGPGTAGQGPEQSGGAGSAVRQNAPAGGTGTAQAGSPAQNGGTVRSVRVTGGQVVLQLVDTGARVLSATPATGYEVQSWQAQGWLRVDFRSSGHTSSVFVTWNGHPPSVQTAES